ncbi:MAG: hypothetical protein KKH94_11595 [Candidatus Omnitrophica bacterium]|nr:hypothetical protein [Candidatus Omnitrophota bacterium]
MNFIQKYFKKIRSQLSEDKIYRQIVSKRNKARKLKVPELIECLYFHFIKPDDVQEIIIGGTKYVFTLNLHMMEPGLREGNLEVYQEKMKVFDVEIVESYELATYARTSDYQLGEINGFLNGGWIEEFKKYYNDRKEKVIKDEKESARVEKEKKIQRLKKNFGI